ncbi:MAG TPA: ketoacyl-ACP synthase III [Anaerolineaceae bacterium]|nr:ketoacyl-ACP synthase III [Anaerolineaceae bacterium]HPN53231.1 ketoacyl-ACP synthase III [Anaerolineaceae bacterium]
MTRYATILGTGSYLPPIERTNAEMAARFGEVIGKFEKSSGITTRFYAPEGWVTSDLAVEAAKAALQDAGLKPEDLSMIILGTDSPDYITPATSVVVQHKLGAVNAGTFDIACACASFPTGLNIASGLLSTQSQMKYVLVVGAYMMHKLADCENDVMSFFYGDGAGAAVLGVSDKPGFVSSTFFADGSYHKHWGIYSGGVFEPASHESVEAGRTKVRLITPFPPTVNDNGWPARMRELAANGNFDLKDVNMALYTQVRYNTIALVHRDTLGLDMARTHWVMDKWGYTGSACIPMVFDDARKQGKIKSGDLVTFVGSGVGYNQAGSAFIMP